MELESTLSSIQPQLIRLREELDVSEREFNAARFSKDQFLLTVAKDQEEETQIRVRLRQNGEEIIRLKEELEARKKDTNRQKGMLEINRRQLATSEAEKQRLVNEIAQESEKVAQAAKEIQALSSPTAHLSSPVLSSSLTAPPLPAPRGSRKDPPPPPASRGTTAALVSRPTPEEEEAFGIPEALRSPTGSFNSMHSPRMSVPTAVSRQSTGPSPFDSIPRQGTSSSPFESISRQGTGSSPFDPIPHQDTGMSAKAPSIISVGEGNTFLSISASGAMDQEDMWSLPNTKAAGQPQTTMSPDPEALLSPQQDSTLALAAGQLLPTTSPSMSRDPFAFRGFADKPSQSTGLDNIKSAEAFAEAFPALDSVEGFDGAKANRMSAFGFEDDFGGVSPFTQTLEKSKEEDEFPPIVEMTRPDEDSSDDSDDDNEEAFVQAKSSITSPEPSSTPVPMESFSASAAAVPATLKVQGGVISAPKSAPTSQPAAIASTEPTAITSTEPTAPAAPVETGSSTTKKLTDYSEFESSSFGGTSFGETNDDFESAFKGVELAAPKVSSAVDGSILGFDDGFDFNASFDDAFGSTSSPFGGAGATTTSSSAFGVGELDKSFGDFGGSGSAVGGSNAFGNGFSNFEAEFFSSGTGPSTTAPTSTTIPAAAATSLPRPAIPAPTNKINTTATTAPAPPQVSIAGVEELINMGFTKQQAENALLRYDTVERAANFLLGG
ncbi:hypothetical protein BGZ65_008829, partial [Modicella reniformis]